LRLNFLETVFVPLITGLLSLAKAAEVFSVPPTIVSWEIDYRVVAGRQNDAIANASMVLEIGEGAVDGYVSPSGGAAADDV
jgi:hypothetical protein